MSKIEKRVFVSVVCIFAILSAVLLFWYFGDTYKDFYLIASSEFEIAGLEDGYTPQGLTYEKVSKTFLTCGYMKDGSASRIYVIDAETNQTTKYFTLKKGQENYVGHAGGIATDGTNVWICGDGEVHRFSFSEIESVENGKSLTIVDSFESQNGADFLTIENNNLWVGEFERAKNYERPESHQFETSNGINKALSFCYEINSSKECGLESLTPIKALSTGSLVQGMIINNDKIVLSVSYSLPNSHILCYENILNQSTQKTFVINGKTIPVFVLDSQNLKKEIEAPCMSEEIVDNGEKIYVLFESACKKYQAVTREQLRNVYSIKLESLENI